MGIKAQIATVRVGSASIEGLMSEGGHFGVAVPQYADLFETSRNTASRDLKRLLKKPDEWEFEKWITPFNPAPVNILTMDMLFEVSLALYNKNQIKSGLIFV